MVRLPAPYPVAPVQLFQENDAHHLVRESKVGKADPPVRPLSHFRGYSQGTADDEHQVPPAFRLPSFMHCGKALGVIAGPVDIQQDDEAPVLDLFQQTFSFSDADLLLRGFRCPVRRLLVPYLRDLQPAVRGEALLVFPDSIPPPALLQASDGQLCDIHSAALK